jgi:hypothetical protein
MFAFVGSHMCGCMDTGMAQRTPSKKRTTCAMIIQQLYDYHVVLGDNQDQGITFWTY